MGAGESRVSLLPEEFIAGPPGSTASLEVPAEPQWSPLELSWPTRASAFVSEPMRIPATISLNVPPAAVPICGGELPAVGCWLFLKRLPDSLGPHCCLAQFWSPELPAATWSGANSPAKRSSDPYCGENLFPAPPAGPEILWHGPHSMLTGDPKFYPFLPSSLAVSSLPKRCRTTGGEQYGSAKSLAAKLYYPNLVPWDPHGGRENQLF